jgi:hypothetical protein
MLATIVDWSTLLELAGAALAAGVGVTAAFSLVIYGAARASDMRRADRTLAAGAYGAIAALALAACAALVVYGIQVMVEK